MPRKYLLCALSISMIRFCNDIAQIVEITLQDSIVGSIAQLLGLSPFELCLAPYFFEEASSPFPVHQISGARITEKALMLLLKDIVPAAQNNIDTRFILLDKGRTTLEGQNKTCLALVADETAAVHYQFWGDECVVFEPGDIIHLANGIFSYHRSNLVLRAGKRGKVEKVGEFTMAFVETPNLSEIHWIPDPNNSKKYVQEYVISPHSRIFPPIT